MNLNLTLISTQPTVHVIQFNNPVNTDTTSFPSTHWGGEGVDMSSEKKNSDILATCLFDKSSTELIFTMQSEETI